MKINLKSLTLASLALIITQSTFAANPGKYTRVEQHVQCEDGTASEIAKFANRSAKSPEYSLMYKNEVISVFLSGLYLSIHVENNQGSTTFSYTDEFGSTLSGKVSVTLETGDFINLIGQRTWDSNQIPNHHSVCDFSARYTRIE